MRAGKVYVYAVLAVVAAVAAYFASSLAPEQSLVFRERDYPPGFRELVLDASASRFDAAAIVQPMSPTGAAAKPSVPALCEALFRDASSPAIGKADSPVRIAAFLDYRCPYCRTLADIIAALPADRFRIHYKEWPILGEPSLLAARAALAAERQGKYPALHARLMRTRLIPTQKLVEDIAAELGMDPARLREDMRAPATAAALARTSALARAFGFIGTPALVVGRTVAQGAITRRQLDLLIEDEAKARAKVC